MNEIVSESTWMVNIPFLVNLMVVSWLANFFSFFREGQTITSGDGENTHSKLSGKELYGKPKIFDIKKSEKVMDYKTHIFVQEFHL